MNVYPNPVNNSTVNVYHNPVNNSTVNVDMGVSVVYSDNATKIADDREWKKNCPGFANSCWDDDLTIAMTKAYKRWCTIKECSASIKSQKLFHDKKAKEVLRRFSKR